MSEKEYTVAHDHMVQLRYSAYESEFCKLYPDPQENFEKFFGKINEQFDYGARRTELYISTMERVLSKHESWPEIKARVDAIVAEGVTMMEEHAKLSVQVLDLTQRLRSRFDIIFYP